MLWPCYVPTTAFAGSTAAVSQSGPVVGMIRVSPATTSDTRHSRIRRSRIKRRWKLLCTWITHCRCWEASMSYPMEVDEKKPVTLNEQARVAWNTTVQVLVELMWTRLGRAVPGEAVEEYLVEELRIEGPLDAEFNLAGADALSAFIDSLAQADFEDAFAYGVRYPRPDETAQDDDADVSAEEEHYSSEDDETPFMAEQFTLVVEVIQYLNRSIE